MFQKGYGFIYFLDGVGGERAAAARTLMIDGGRVRCEMGLSHQMHMEDRLHVGGEREEGLMSSSSSLSLSSSLSSRTPSRTMTPLLVPAPERSSFPANPSFPTNVGDLQSWFALHAPFYPPPLLYPSLPPLPYPPLLLTPPPPPPPPPLPPPHVSSLEDAMMYQRWGPAFPPLSVIPRLMPSHPLPSMPTPYYPGSNEYVVRVSVAMSSSANYSVPPAALSPPISISMDEDRRRGVRGERGGRVGRSRRDRSESQSK